MGVKPLFVLWALLLGASTLGSCHSPASLCTCTPRSQPFAGCPQGHTLHPHLAGCCLPCSCSTASTSPQHPKQHAHQPSRLTHHPPPAPGQHSTSEAADAAAGPAPDWMAQCCSSMLLRQMFLPGTHDSGTYAWTTPQHMPLVLDEVLAILFNIVGDLSRTQHMDVYGQLQAGARVVDIRLAINPWLAVQARAQSRPVASDGSSSHLPAAAPSLHTTQQHGIASGLRSWLAHAARKLRGAFLSQPTQQQQQQHMPLQGAAERAPPPRHLQLAFDLDPELLEGRLDLASVGGPLSAAERRGCIVTSHSLPGAPLVTVLRDVRRFLQENPGELVVLLVKEDTIDVNVAGSLRFTSQDWEAAAEVFSQELAGVQLVDKRQVQMLTIGQLAQGSRGGGSVLLYSSELQQQGLVAVSSRQARILESWGNGTNTEDVGQLKQRLVDWLLFWRSANWRHNQKPFLLLASAQTTLGVRTILQMVKNRLWGWLSTTPARFQAQPRLQRAAMQWRALQRRHQQRQLAGREDPKSEQGPLQQGVAVGPLASGLTTLYQLGVATNQQLMQEVLQNEQVPKEFNVWSLDAISHDMSSYIVGLNTAVQPSTAQE